MTFRTEQGFTLVEVTLALGVAAVSLLVIFSLLPIGLQTNQHSVEQTASVDILSAVAADLRATPRGIGSSSLFNITIPSNPMSGSTSIAPIYFDSAGQVVTSPDTARYRVTVTFFGNGGGTRTATFCDLKATWPAEAAAEEARGVSEIFVAFDRN